MNPRTFLEVDGSARKTWSLKVLSLIKGGGGPSADLRQEFGQAAKYTSFQDRLMKFSGLALGTVVYTLK